MAATTRAVTRVEAEEFVLRDSHGRVRSLLSVNEDVPALVFFDGQGKVCARLDVQPDGATNLTLSGGSRFSRLIASVMEGAQELVMVDPQGVDRVRLTVTADGSRLALLDEDGRSVFQAP